MSPIKLSMELQHKMQVSPDNYYNERDPRKFSSWDQRRFKATKSLPYPRYFHNESFLPDKPHYQFAATPDSPERLPPQVYTPVKPTKLTFSPKPNKIFHYDGPKEILGLMFPYRQDDELPTITDVDVI